MKDQPQRTNNLEALNLFRKNTCAVCSGRCPSMTGEWVGFVCLLEEHVPLEVRSSYHSVTDHQDFLTSRSTQDASGLTKVVV